ncbi:unnamed protein product [Mesocestoides corti]|uniref:C3H1-type domain-containing protein n=1 Tax=Mesocestoides corti TaxID=53468 RepID=A0A0R3U692_MESCO|nr:unnamed protein product [Mesocestoides corti]
MQADAVVTKAPTKSADSCQNTVNADSDVCRDFLRNVCKRGRKCKFKHPTSSSSCDSSRLILNTIVALLGTVNTMLVLPYTDLLNCNESRGYFISYVVSRISILF